MYQCPACRQAFSAEAGPDFEVNGETIGDRYVVVQTRPHPILPPATIVHECHVGDGALVPARVTVLPPLRSESIALNPDESN